MTQTPGALCPMQTGRRIHDRAAVKLFYKKEALMNPVILLSGGTSAAANGTPSWALNQNYADNIRRVGGIPLLAVNNDCAEEYADLADGLLLSGGKDVDPALYGEKLKYDFVITDPLRDELEIGRAHV